MRLLPDRKSAWAAYLLFVALFFVYLVNAARVYHALSGKTHAVKLRPDFPLYPKGQFGYSLFMDPSMVNSPFAEGVEFKALFWRALFAAGNPPLRAFLRSTDALYEVAANRQSFWPQKHRPLMQFFVSTAGLEKGIYQLGLYLFEGTGGRFEWTRHVFEKADGGPAEYVARPLVLGPARISHDLKFRIEGLWETKGLIEIRGWVAVDNVEMSDYDGYIKIESPAGVAKAFYAPLYTRMDIASMYEDPKAANCGFRIRIPKSEIGAGRYSIKVAVQHRKTHEIFEPARAWTKNF